MWPWWLHRQLDPGSPAWLPADLAGHNRTGRNWTVIGIPEREDRWRVDGRGLLAPSSGRWALDWWVGCDDRWRLPSQEASVRQRLVDAAPVLETTMRVPGGEIVARHWAVPADPADAEEDLVIVEIDNAGSAAVAVALVLRPVGPAGPAGLHRVAVTGGRLEVDGRTVVRPDLAPRQTAVSDGAGGDVAATVLANATPPTRDREVVCPLGWASAAMVWPLAPRAALRVEIPGRRRSHRPGWSQGAGPGSGPGPGRVGPRPTPVATARGWAARVSRGTRLDLPDGPLASALEAQRRHLLLALPVEAEPADEGPEVTSSVRVRAAQVVAASSTAGLRDEAAGQLDAWLDDQHRDGRIGRDDIDTAATLWALVVWARTGPDDGLVSRAPLAIARAVERLAAPRAPADPVAATWTLAGVHAGARLLALAGEEEAAGQARRWARARSEALLAQLGSVGASAGFDRVTEASLRAVGLGVMAPRHPVACAARSVARRPVRGLPAGAMGPTPLLGLRPALSLAFATSAALAGDQPDEAIGWVLSVASSTWTWPTVIAPRLGTGSHGSGHDPVVAAALWSCGRALLVADAADDIDILPALPAEWVGVGFEVHGLPTAAGPLAYAVRWHGERPALLWELEGAGPVPAVTAPGLDPTWRGRGRSGEALLGVYPVPAPVPDGSGGLG